MRHKILGQIAVIALILGVISCNKEKEESRFFVYSGGPAEMEGTRNSRTSLEFGCSSSWRASVSEDWLTVFPMAGAAGKASLTVIAKQSNLSGENRSAEVLVTAADGKTLTFNVLQTASEVLLLESNEYVIPDAGGELRIRFKSNVSGKKLLYTYTNNVQDWIKPVKDANTKALEDLEYIMEVLPNPDHSPRTAEFYIEIVNPDDYNECYMSSDVITVSQEGIKVDTSTDYSRDGKVVRICSHSAGAGIPIVLMGDGFADCDISNGYYDSVMRKAADNLFSEEPLKSMKEYFDIWYVNCVSANNSFDDPYSTCFSCKFDEEGSSRITGDGDKVLQYIFKIPELASIEQLSRTLSIVILNSSKYAGTTGFAFSGLGEFAMVFCPVVDGLDSERFRSVLVHESIGHGFAKLYDEYSYESYGEISISTANQVRMLQNDYGWAANVSLSGSASSVPWSHLLSDGRYSAADNYGETLGIYEGACTYWTGAWRPTEDSMMRTNRHGFNAPSREAIYKRLMKEAYGADWKYDVGEFIEFDLAHLPAPQPETRSAESGKIEFTHPLPPPLLFGNIGSNIL